METELWRSPLSISHCHQSKRRGFSEQCGTGHPNQCGEDWNEVSVLVCRLGDIAWNGFNGCSLIYRLLQCWWQTYVHNGVTVLLLLLLRGRGLGMSLPRNAGRTEGRHSGPH